jgi:membrane-associated phospholipid phosphatase
MRHYFIIIIAILGLHNQLIAQVEPGAGKWKTWFISSGKEYRLPAPSSTKSEISKLIKIQEEMDSATLAQIQYWNAGAPGYRWQAMIDKLWKVDTGNNGVLANLLVGVATYDATIAAWDTKYAFNTKRPFESDKRIKLLTVDPQSPSYPCEHSVAAGVASTIISHFYPKMADSVKKLAMQVMNSRVAAGVAFPSDASAGFELGKMIAEKAIMHTQDFIPKTPWDGKRPEGPGVWQGKPMFPVAGQSKTLVLESGEQFRPAPPPDFAKEMEELKNFKPTFRSVANAFHYASNDDDVLGKKIFEYNLHLNPPRASRIYAYTAIASYDGFIACWDAKYAYWGTRPDQYDTSFRPVLFFTPPFPGYPSGHAMIGGVYAEVYAYFFPADKAYFDKRAKDGAESRFQGGIHFRSDNEVGLQMGRQIGSYIIQRAKYDGADKDLSTTIQKRTVTRTNNKY